MKLEFTARFNQGKRVDEIFRKTWQNKFWFNSLLPIGSKKKQSQFF